MSKNVRKDILIKKEIFRRSQGVVASSNFCKSCLAPLDSVTVDAELVK